jgi:hypothetical protein
MMSVVVGDELVQHEKVVAWSAKGDVEELRVAMADLVIVQREQNQWGSKRQQREHLTQVQNGRTTPTQSSQSTPSLP